MDRDVHLKVRFVGQNASLPVLLEVLRCHHADGLDLHGFKTEGNDVVHSFNDGASFTGEWNTCWTEFHWHLFPPPKPTQGTSHDNVFLLAVR